MKKSFYCRILIVMLSSFIVSFSFAQTPWNLEGNRVTDTSYVGSNNYKDLIFKTDSLERMTISKDGNINIEQYLSVPNGIITTDSIAGVSGNDINVLNNLNVKGTLKSDSIQSNASDLKINSNLNLPDKWIHTDSLRVRVIHVGDSSLVIGNPSNGAINNQGNNIMSNNGGSINFGATNGLVLNGNFPGVNIGTIAPTFKLHVHDDNTGSSNAYLQFTNSGVAGGGTGQTINSGFRIGITTSNTAAVNGQANIVQCDNKPINFYTSAFAGINPTNQRMQISGFAPEVGIGSDAIGGWSLVLEHAGNTLMQFHNPLSLTSYQLGLIGNSTPTAVFPFNTMQFAQNSNAPTFFYNNDPQSSGGNLKMEFTCYYSGNTGANRMIDLRNGVRFLNPGYFGMTPMSVDQFISSVDLWEGTNNATNFRMGYCGTMRGTGNLLNGQLQIMSQCNGGAASTNAGLFFNATYLDANGTATPTSLEGYSNMYFNLDDVEIGRIQNTTNPNTVGYWGIGQGWSNAIRPKRRLDVLDVNDVPQFRITQTPSNLSNQIGTYSDFEEKSSGELWVENVQNTTAPLANTDLRAMRVGYPVLSNTYNPGDGLDVNGKLFVKTVDEDVTLPLNNHVLVWVPSSSNCNVPHNLDKKLGLVVGDFDS